MANGKSLILNGTRSRAYISLQGSPFSCSAPRNFSVSSSFDPAFYGRKRTLLQVFYGMQYTVVHALLHKQWDLAITVYKLETSNCSKNKVNKNPP
jgi:hypothetical protein